ncbi:hypothetical protein ACFWBG_11100 [Nocardia salmonicida]|uniref:hypothetical protein n=1 Tax=Nocardia salmonicida TaxID=53431 RepID=UPI00366FA67B
MYTSVPHDLDEFDDWFPVEGDVRLRIWLTDVALDFVASVTAARNLIADWQRSCWCAIEIVNDARDLDDLPPRLPCERLFSGP